MLNGEKPENDPVTNRAEIKKKDKFSRSSELYIKHI